MNNLLLPLELKTQPPVKSKSLDFLGRLSNFHAQITPKSVPSRSKNNPQTLPKLLQSNFEKVQKPLFFDHQKCRKIIISNIKA